MANIKPLPKASVLSYDTIQKLVQLKLKDLADYVNEVESQDVCADMTFKEKFSMIIDRLYNSRSNETILKLRRAAHLREPQAFLDYMYFEEGRHLSKETVVNLCTCDFMRYGNNIVIEGSTGTGKTYLACCIANAAIEKCFKVKYVRMPDLDQELCEWRANPEKRRSTFRKRLASPALLILDEWLSRPISEELKRLIFDVVEDRLGKSSTIFCSQHSFSSRMEQLGNGCETESLVDRVIHNATSIVLDGKCNMREIAQKYHLNQSR